jgi:DNA polymerase elongation subunit (family B)
MNQKQPRIITIDIETSPLESYTWGIWEQNVSVDQIKTEWTILSYAVKTLGDPKIRYKDTGGRGVKKVRDDKSLLLDIHKELDDADIVIAQNGRAFDTKKVNARMVMHGIKPYSPVRVIDTLEVAKKHFRFTSNKLQWLSKHLTDQPKDDHKEFPGMELWIECLNDNPRAWKVMKKYNEQDVLSAELVYLRMRPWIAQHPNLSVFSEGGATKCPKCDSTHVQKRGYEVTQASRYQRFQCMDCSGWSRGKALLTPARERKSLLVSV